MPRVGVGVVVHQAEADDQRQAPVVGEARGQFQRRIAGGALGLLHPVQNIGAVALGLVVEPADPFGLDHRGAISFR